LGKDGDSTTRWHVAILSPTRYPSLVDGLARLQGEREAAMLEEVQAMWAISGLLFIAMLGVAVLLSMTVVH
jgi:hypothetical protein